MWESAGDDLSVLLLDPTVKRNIEVKSENHSMDNASSATSEFVKIPTPASSPPPSEGRPHEDDVDFDDDGTFNDEYAPQRDDHKSASGDGDSIRTEDGADVDMVEEQDCSRSNGSAVDEEEVGTNTTEEYNSFHKEEGQALQNAIVFNADQYDGSYQDFVVDNKLNRLADNEFRADFANNMCNRMCYIVEQRLTAAPVNKYKINLELIKHYNDQLYSHQGGYDSARPHVLHLRKLLTDLEERGRNRTNILKLLRLTRELFYKDLMQHHLVGLLVQRGFHSKAQVIMIS